MNAAHGFSPVRPRRSAQIPMDVPAPPAELADGLCTFGLIPASCWDSSVDGETRTARTKRVALARALCAACPVAEICRGYAHTVPETFGIWGGRMFLGQDSIPNRDLSPALRSGG